MVFEWGIERSCLPPLPTLPDTPTGEEQAAYDAALAQRSAAEDLAVSTLWALSGRQFGLVATLVRPCPPQPYHSCSPGAPWVWTLDGHNWAEIGCGCANRCTRSGPGAVHLPGPVYAVTAVRLGDDDTDLDASQYVLEGDVLYRRGDATVWPGQNAARPLGESGTWSVTYQRGRPVPPGVDRLAGLLAREFIVACGDGEDECRLPRTVVATAQRGATLSFDPTRILGAGKTGLEEIDLWLAGVNPHALAHDAVVL